MEFPSVLDEPSPYYQVHDRIPNTWWFVPWRRILQLMREQWAGTCTVPLPVELQDPRGLIGLSIGLFFRQAAIAADYLVPISWRDDVSEWAL